MNQKTNLQHLFSIPVIVAALGYFVDIYDLLLFGIVRIPSLRDLGLSENEISIVGKSIMNWQMSGLLIGGILWGVLGDKKGRLSVLFGSIITYSLMNIACGFVQDPTTYKILRFVAGIGLAGELGAGITLVSEILPKNLRAIGTSLVAGVGLLGAVVAYFTVQLFTWRIAFFIGGGLGFALLMLRIGVFESGMFKEVLDKKELKKGDFLSFFSNKDRFYRYIKCIAIGLPTWFVIGLLATLSNEFGEALGMKITPGLAIMWCYVGLSIGDLASGFLSQYLASRKKAVASMLLFTLVVSIFYFYGGIKSTNVFYGVCLLMGFGIGYWAMFVTIAAEQFGTNMRATAATTVPNMVRGMVVPMNLIYSYFKPTTIAENPSAVLNAGAIVGTICFAFGFWAVATISETHGRDLNFVEEN